MRVELTSGNWVEVRENLKGRDRTATQSALRFTIRDGQQSHELGADVTDLMHDHLLASLVTAWSFEAPVPSVAGGVDALLDLDIDDYNELHVATAPLFKKVTAKSPN